MKKQLILLGIFAMLGFQLSFAQTVNITGLVKDGADNSPIPGVSVFVKGTTIGTVTNIDGEYNLSVPADAAVLTFSFVGMTTQEIAIDGQKEINVILHNDSENIDEVMVVAYGTAKKESFTGSASVVKGDQIQKLQTSSVSKALEGTTSGVQVVSSSGQPGSDAAIRIRGIGSINASSSPLIVLDGVPYDGAMNSINPQDIETMTVLKDAASAALYGSRGANGVIMITTKKGKAGQTKISADARFGVNTRAVPTYDIMTDSRQYLGTIWSAYRNSIMNADGMTMDQANTIASEQIIAQLGGYNPFVGVANNQVVNTDGTVTSAPYLYKDNWMDEVFSNGTRQEYNLNFNGGSDKTTHYLSLGYLNDEGIISGSSFDRLSIRGNLEYEVNDHIKIGSNLSYARGEQNAPRSSSGGAFANPFLFTQNVAPIYPVFIYDMDGNRMHANNGDVLYDFGDSSMPGTSGRPYGSLQNPASMSKTDLNQNISDNFSNRTYVSVDFLKDFNFTANLAYDLRNRNATVFYSPINGDAANVKGRSSKTANRYQTITTNQLLRYNKTLGQHKLQVLAGHESYKYTGSTLYGQKTNFLISDNHELANAVEITSLTSYLLKHTIESYLTNVTYDFKDRYYLSASFRTDGSSKFHPDNRWGNFWSVGGSWRVSEEEFMSNIEWVDNLKLKGSYGVQGNDAILDAGGYAVYYPYKDLYDVVNYNGELSISLAYKGNPDLSWEVSNNLNVGFELVGLESRLRFDFEYFQRATSDLLFNNPYPISSGIVYRPENVADMINKGIDLSLSYDLVRRKDFTWNMAILGSHYTNEITKLPADKRENGIVSGTQLMHEGGSIYDFYLIEYAGVNPETGAAQYWKREKDANGRISRSIVQTYEEAASSQDSRTIVGSALPDFQGSWNNTFNYKNIDFSVITNFQIGGLVYDGNYASMMHSGEMGKNWHKDILNAWTPENTKTDVPRIETNYQDANQGSDRFLIDASYFNIRNLTLGYTLPSRLSDNLNVASLRVYAAADNVALFSKRRGMDPRQYFSGTNSSFNYAPIRTVSCGVSVNF